MVINWIVKLVYDMMQDVARRAKLRKMSRAKRRLERGRMSAGSGSDLFRVTIKNFEKTAPQLRDIICKTSDPIIIDLSGSDIRHKATVAFAVRDILNELPANIRNASGKKSLRRRIGVKDGYRLGSAQGFKDLIFEDGSF